jgi:hypothetical protein
MVAFFGAGTGRDTGHGGYPVGHGSTTGRWFESCHGCAMFHGPRVYTSTQYASAIFSLKSTRHGIYIYIYMYHNDTATRSTTSLFQPGRSHDIKQIDANSSSSTPPHPICVNVSPIPKERRVMQCMVVCGVCSFIPRLLPSKPDAAAHAHDDDDDDDDKVLQTPVKSKSKSKSKSSQGNDVLLYCSIRFVSIATLAVRCCSSSCSMCACVRVCPK